MLERFSAGHDERGIAALAERLARAGVERVAIERPDGILVERLLAAGLEVLAIHPNQVKAARARFAKRLRLAVATLADSTRHWNPWAKEVYRRARARGQDHPHAIRSLGRAWIRVLWRWRDRVQYDPARHGNFNRLQTAGG